MIKIFGIITPGLYGDWFLAWFFLNFLVIDIGRLNMTKERGRPMKKGSILPRRPLLMLRLSK